MSFTLQIVVRRRFAHMFTILNKLYITLLDGLYPPYCPNCRRLLAAPTILCTACHEKIMPVVTSIIRITPTITLPVYAVGRYEDPLRRLILGKSHSDIVASKLLGQLMLQHTQIAQITADYLVPVPLHWTRYAYRGYNQATELARVIKRQTGIPLLHAVKRVRRTPFQSSIKVNKRAQNVRHVFKAKWGIEKIRDKNIVLIDDLCTTGSTLRAVAKVLVKYKPASIIAFVVARVD